MNGSLLNRCFNHPRRVIREGRFYCLECRGARRIGYRKPAQQQREALPQVCPGNHDLHAEAYQCKACGWWLVPRAPTAYRVD
jgi:hypothetical protein